MVEISPSGVAPVCQAGDQLELTCSVTGVFLRWEFTVILDDGSATTIMPVITPEGPNGVPPPLMVNSTSFTFSRLSTQDNSPLILAMTINPVSEGLNGVQVRCEDVGASESVNSTIRIVDTRDQGRKFDFIHSYI